MKNKIKILYAVVSVLTFIGISSCNNDEFLTVDHYSILPADQMFKSDEDAKAGLVGCYDLMLPSGDVDGDGNIDYNGDWGFKPNLFVGGHPTMDTQATGWDKDWNTFPATRVRNGGYGIASVSAKYQLTPQWDLSLSGDNIFNKKYTTAYGYNTAGASVMLRCLVSASRRSRGSRQPCMASAKVLLCTL